MLSQLLVRLPSNLKRELKQKALTENTSMNALITSAILDTYDLNPAPAVDPTTVTLDEFLEQIENV